MSEIKTLEVEVTHPDILDVDVDFGQTLTKIVAPEHYMGPFEFHVSDEDQVIPVKDKTPAEDICVRGITGEKTVTQNGTYNTLEDKTVTVNVQPDLQPLSVSENGTYQPDGFDGYSQVMVNVEKLGVLIKTETLDHDEAQSQGDPFFWYRYFNLGSGIFFLFFDNNGYLNTNYNSRAVDMICFVTSPDAKTQSLVMSRNGYNDPRNSNNSWSWASAGTTIRVYQIPYNLTHDA